MLTTQSPREKNLLNGHRPTKIFTINIIITLSMKYYLTDLFELAKNSCQSVAGKISCNKFNLNNLLSNCFKIIKLKFTCTVSKFNNVKNLMQTAARQRKENKHNMIATFPIDLMPRQRIMKIRIHTIETLNASYL